MWELLIAIAAVVLLTAVVFLLIESCSHASEPARRHNCYSNLSQIAKACIAYQGDNGGFFPAFMQGAVEGGTNPNIPKSGQGSDNTFQPMPSLAVLYPSYIDNVRVFGCPSTNGKPKIAFRYYNGARHTCFGYDIDPLADQPVPNGPNGPQGATAPNAAPTANGYNWTDPAWFTGAEVSTHYGEYKCSYFYDELASPRMMKPDQAVACDADGQTWPDATGVHPPYPADWKRVPRVPNHQDGQNVLYYDGHVKWNETVYAGHDPADNIFCPQAGWERGQRRVSLGRGERQAGSDALTRCR